MALRVLTVEEVAQHHTPDDLWVIIDAKVYDLSRFKVLHPGGVAVLLDDQVAGKDATEAFYSLHRHEVLERPQYKHLQIGTIQGQTSVMFDKLVGEISQVPYGEPTWLTPGYSSPYYSDNHHEFQKTVRRFVDEVLYHDAQAREEDGKRPSRHVFDKMGELNLLAMSLGPGKHLEGRTLMGGLVKPEQYDYFHELVFLQEVIRCGTRAYLDSLLAGRLIGLPPVLNFGSEELKAKVVPDILAGKKFICLAVTEAKAGSDVMGLRTTATLSEDGKEWIINGSKKWITNSTFADYFTVCCRTGDNLTVILVERCPGVWVRPIKTTYSATTAGTGYVTFDNVRVPVGNTVGRVGGGFFVVMSTFNHERWGICCVCAGFQRLVIEECLKWASQRKAFGKPLIAQPAVRAKIASMIARAEGAQSWLENITYQMMHMTIEQQARKLAGPMALLKAHVAQCAQETAQDAVHIFGGRGVTQSGMGKFVERYYRTVMFDAVLGGAQDVLLDLGVRQAMRSMPPNVRL